jgi:transposase-like protein
MLTVETDAESVEARLRSGRVVCPDCGAVVVRWGFARPRWLHTATGRVQLRPRRACCGGCGRTHVLLPATVLARRADVVEVIGAGLEAKAAGWGHRQIARALGRAAGTVRGWLRRFASRAEPIRRALTALAVQADPDSVPAGPAGSEVADAVAAVHAAATAVASRWGGHLLTLSVWQVASAFTHGQLLSAAAPAVLTNTSRLWAGV